MGQRLDHNRFSKPTHYRTPPGEFNKGFENIQDTLRFAVPENLFLLS